MPVTRTHYPLRGHTTRRVRLARVLLTAAARARRPVTVAFTKTTHPAKQCTTLEVFEIKTSHAGHTLVTGIAYYSPTRGTQCVTSIRGDRIHWIQLHKPGYRLHHPWPLNLPPQADAPDTATTPEGPAPNPTPQPQ